jgi:hypothetical protein
MGGEVKLPASILESKAEYSPFAHAAGNFTECRSAVRTILQKGQGKYHSYTSSLSYSFFLSDTRGDMFYFNFSKYVPSKKGCLTFELCSVLMKKL